MKNGCIEKRLAAVGFRTRQRGASLLEGIAYLGIAAIVILGAISLLTNAFGNAQANKASEEVIALRTATRKLFVGQTYPAGATALLVSAGAIPSTLTNTNGVITNAWGGGVTVVGGGVAGVNSFAVTYRLVPNTECINMLSGANGWTDVTVNGTSVAPFPITAAAASNQCNAAAGNTIVFTAV